MKKTYIAPTAEEIRIQTMGLLAASTLGINDSVEVDDTADLLSREDDMFLFE